MDISTIIIGVAGGTASGKSTFTKALAQALTQRAPDKRTEVIGTDRYFRPDKTQEPQFFFQHRNESMFNWNHPDAVDNARLIEDLDARCAAPDRPDVLLLEGLMVLHEAALRERCRLRLFIELEADQRALRRMLRNMKAGPVSADPDFIAAYYLESARVGHNRFVEPSRAHADFILRGDADFGRSAPLLAAMILALPAP